MIHSFTNKQKITRDIEIKNKLTVTKGRSKGIIGGKGEGFSGTSIKDTWTKPKGGKIEGGNGDGGGGEMDTTVLEQ